MGFVQLEEDDVATISALFMMRRSDKQEDRVEISPEQLTAASIQAEVSFNTRICVCVCVCVCMYMCVFVCQQAVFYAYDSEPVLSPLYL